MLGRIGRIIVLMLSILYGFGLGLTMAMLFTRNQTIQVIFGIVMAVLTPWAIFALANYMVKRYRSKT